MNPHILHCCIVLQRIDWLMILTEVNKVALQCKNKLPFPGFLPCRSCSNSMKVTKSAVAMRRGCHDLIAQQFSTIFSLLAVIFRTKLNKTTSRRFQLHLRKAAFCSVISFHLFPSFCNTICQEHVANHGVPGSVKTPQYRVRKCVHEGKPRATNRSRVNPIAVQCKVGK